MASSEVVVLGGGAAGCAITYYLSKAGIRVILVDKDAIGSHASGFAFGGLNFNWVYEGAYQTGSGASSYLLDPSRESYRMHGVLFNELLESTGVDTYYREGFELNLAFRDDDLYAIKQAVKWQQERGLDTEYVDASTIHRMEPRVTQEVIGGSLMKDAGSVEAYRYVLALLQASETMGAVRHHGTAVGIRHNGPSPVAVVMEDGEIACDTVVIALGPWSGSASAWLDFPVPVEPVRGQILRLQFDEPPLACPVNYLNTYAGSKPSDGLVWCGTTFERAGFDDNTTVDARNRVLEGTLRLIPALESAQLVLQTACLRPISSDDLPILGPVPGWERVYLATGAGTEGILLSPFFGRTISDLVLGKKLEWDISPFLPERFANQAL